MLGRIYTFERLSEPNTQSADLLSSVALRAVTLATHGERGIRFEQLTDFDNPRPMVVVLFTERDAVRRFDQKLLRQLSAVGISVSVLGTSLGCAEPSSPQLDSGAWVIRNRSGGLQSGIGS